MLLTGGHIIGIDVHTQWLFVDLFVAIRAKITAIVHCLAER